MARTDYRKAACRDEDPELFFPLGDPETGWQVEQAKDVCRGCPISEECLQDNIEARFGVYAATTPRERQKIQQSPWYRRMMGANR